MIQPSCRGSWRKSTRCGGANIARSASFARCARILSRKDLNRADQRETGEHFFLYDEPTNEGKEGVECRGPLSLLCAFAPFAAFCSHSSVMRSLLKTLLYKAGYSIKKIRHVPRTAR